MSGYLVALAATAIGVAPTVSPRRRSRFEPSQVVGLPPEHAVTRVALPVPADLPPEAPPPPTPRRSPVARADAALAPIRPALAPAEFAVPGHRPAPRLDPVVAPPPIAPGTPDRPRLVAVRAAGPATTLPAPAYPPRADDSVPDRPEAAAPRVPDSRPVALVAPQAVGVLLPPLLAASAPAPVTPSPTAVRPAPAAAPEVRVTIGRLEVRTGPAVVPPPPPPTPTGLRSLEEYGAARGGAVR